MSICTFGNIITIINAYLKEDTFTQCELMIALFNSFYDDNPDYAFEKTTVNKWIKGVLPVPAILKQYYHDPVKAEDIGTDFENIVHKHIFDMDMMTQKIYELLISDNTISEAKKAELTEDFPFADDTFRCVFVGRVISLTFERKQYSNDAIIALRQCSLADKVTSANVPEPCKYFCGRDNDLTEFHEIMSLNDKVFLTGIPGVGKSEFIKAYAKRFKKEYGAIFYFNYTGDLKELVTDAEFIDEISAVPGKKEEYFKRHHKFFHNLGKECLIIIDNFNAAENTDKFLPQMMSYNCKIVFTTRCIFENGYSHELKDIEDTTILVDLMAKFYSEAEEYKEELTEIIEAVHHHILAVVLCAKLLENGNRSPGEIMTALAMDSADPDTNEKIKMNKDGINTKAPYYQHLRALCSFTELDEDMQYVIGCMTLIPEQGIRKKAFAVLTEIEDLDNVNDLIELGYISNSEADIIALHPLISDIAADDIKPSYNNYSAFIENIHTKNLSFGMYSDDWKLTIGISTRIIQNIVKDDISAYIKFTEDSFSLMDTHEDINGMYLCVFKLESILRDKEVGTNNDRALLLNFRACLKITFENKFLQAEQLQKKALNICEPEENPLLYANLNMNMGVIYYDNYFPRKALEYMEKAVNMLDKTNIDTANYYAMLKNYCDVIAANQEYGKAISLLEQNIVKARAVGSAAYPDLLFDTAVLCFISKQQEKGIEYMEMSAAEYKKINAADKFYDRLHAYSVLFRQNKVEFSEDYYLE